MQVMISRSPTTSYSLSLSNSTSTMHENLSGNSVIFPQELHPHIDLSNSIRFGAVVMHCRRLMLGFLVALWL